MEWLDLRKYYVMSEARPDNQTRVARNSNRSGQLIRQVTHQHPERVRGGLGAVHRLVHRHQQHPATRGLGHHPWVQYRLSRRTRHHPAAARRDRAPPPRRRTPATDRPGAGASATIAGADRPGADRHADVAAALPRVGRRAVRPPRPRPAYPRRGDDHSVPATATAHRRPAPDRRRRRHDHRPPRHHPRHRGDNEPSVLRSVRARAVAPGPGHRSHPQTREEATQDAEEVTPAATTPATRRIRSMTAPSTRRCSRRSTSGDGCL